MRTFSLTMIAAVALAGCFFTQTDENAFEDAKPAGASTASSSGASSASGSSASSSGTSGRSVSSSSSGSSGSLAGSSSSSSGSSSGASNSTGSSGSSGSSGNAPDAGVLLLAPSSGETQWTALAGSPNGASTPRMTVVGYNSTGPNAYARVFDLEGNPIVGSGEEVLAYGAAPRAVSDDGIRVVLLGQPDGGTWSTLALNVVGGSTVSLADAGWFPCFGTDCGEPVDLAISGTPSVTLTTGQAGFKLSRLPSSASVWTPCTYVEAATGVQLMRTASNAVVLAQDAASPKAGHVYWFGDNSALCDAPANKVETTLTGPTAADLDSASVDVAGTGSDGGAATAQVASSGPQPASRLPFDGEIAGVAVQQANRAYLYTAPDGGVMVYRLAGTSPGSLPTGDLLAPVLGPNGAGITRAGRQIAITSTGAVFFITSSGAWFWPAP